MAVSPIFCQPKTGTTGVFWPNFAQGRTGIPAQRFDAFDTEEEACEAVEDEHHMLFDCSGYASARIHFQDLFSSNVTTVGQFLNQPDCTRVAKFLIWARALRVNFARV